MIFRNDNHGVLFEKEIRYHKGCSRKMTAALYLLTADSRLWHQAIITGSQSVALTELADPSLLSPRYFMVIQTAMLIRGYGLNAAGRVLFTEGGNQNEF